MEMARGEKGRESVKKKGALWGDRVKTAGYRTCIPGERRRRRRERRRAVGGSAGLALGWVTDQAPNRLQAGSEVGSAGPALGRATDLALSGLRGAQARPTQARRSRRACTVTVGPGRTIRQAVSFMFRLFPLLGSEQALRRAGAQRKALRGRVPLVSGASSAGERRHLAPDRALS